MYSGKATIEIFRFDRWQAAGVFRPEDFRQGYRGSNRFEYLLEYIKRDIVNVVMGNKDNHAWNTAVMRYEDGCVVLAPLFDFAPMYLDPEGIARVCRWEGNAEQAGNPDWGADEDIIENRSRPIQSHASQLLAL